VAEVRKRGPEFWDEFEFYLSDLVVGCVLDVVLVSLMAPVATLGAAKPGKQSGERAPAREPVCCMHICFARHCICIGGPERTAARHAACRHADFISLSPHM